MPIIFLFFCTLIGYLIGGSFGALVGLAVGLAIVFGGSRV